MESKINLVVSAADPFFFQKHANQTHSNYKMTKQYSSDFFVRSAVFWVFVKHSGSHDAHNSVSMHFTVTDKTNMILLVQSALFQ